MSRIPAPLRFGLWMALSCACFALLISLIRYLQVDHDVPVFVSTFWRSVFSIVVFLPWFWRAGAGAFRSSHHGLLLLRGVMMITSATLIFVAAVLMPLPEATALSFTTPLFSVLLAVVFLGERIGPRRSIALAVGLAGVLIILRPGAAVFTWAAILPILSALTFAAVVVLGRVLAAHESPQKIAAYIGLWAVPLSLIPALWVWRWPSGEELLWLFLLGIVAAVNMYSLSRALHIGEASQTATWDFLRLPFVAFAAFLWFGQAPEIWTWLGAAVIFASVVYVTWRETKAARAAAGATPAPAEDRA